jgi:hypothetical protein
LPQKTFKNPQKRRSNSGKILPYLCPLNTVISKVFKHLADYFREVDLLAPLSTSRETWPGFHLLGRLRPQYVWIMLTGKRRNI